MNTYEDETDSKITLLEGKIRVKGENSAARPVKLKPGQQASISHKFYSSQSIPGQTADVEQVMAWKNGLFKFQSTPMAEKMRQIERWFNVEVVYEGNVKKDDTITGTMYNNANASEASVILTYAGYNQDRVKINMVNYPISIQLLTIIKPMHRRSLFALWSKKTRPIYFLKITSNFKNCV